MGRVGFLTFSGLALAAIGIIAPIAWDRYKARSALEFHEIGSSLLVGGVEGIEKLRFLYDGRPVPSLSKLDFIFVNAGRTAIRGEDVLVPPHITVADGQVLDVRIQKAVPPDVQVKSSVDSSGKTVSFSFPLLNSKDAVQFSLLVSGRPIPVSTGGRIVGIHAVDIVDRRAESSSVWRQLPWTFYIVAPITALCIVLVLGGLFVLGSEDAIASLWERRMIVPPPAAGVPEQYLSFLDQGFRDDKSDELKRLRTYLRGLPASPALDETQRREFNSMLARALVDTSLIKRGLAGLSVLAIVGLWYTLSALL